MFPKPKSKSKVYILNLWCLLADFKNFKGLQFAYQHHPFSILFSNLATYGKRNKFLLLFLPSVDIWLVCSHIKSTLDLNIYLFAKTWATDACEQGNEVKLYEVTGQV